MIFSYNSKHKNKVMAAFNLETRDGMVMDKSTGNPIKDNLGAPISVKKFGGARKGSLEFINKDVSSLLKLRSKLKNQD